MRIAQALAGRLSYSNVMATIAVFVALGSGAYAATQLPRNSVGTKQLRKGAVTKIKIRKNSVTAAKLRKDSVTGAKVRDGSLRAGDFATGQLPAGPPGSAGPPGPTQGYAISTFTGANPPDASEFDNAGFEEQISLNSAGRLFVFLRGSVKITCSAGGFADLGLFVDGVPAAASGYRIPVGETEHVSLFGISEPVAAGEHTLNLGLDCVSGNLTSINAGGDGAMGAILLGS